MQGHYPISLLFILRCRESSSFYRLTLESSENSAILKSGSQSWGLRQKNTSNALMLLRPSQTQNSEREMPEAALKTVATVHDTIELVPETAATAAPVARGKWHEKFARGR